uniref:Cell wall protein AWA1 isoform X12 n=1 Tax=Drosophila rhopaloa TaxID=1041015 RepID=A0A6P4FQ56_DRORH
MMMMDTMDTSQSQPMDIAPAVAVAATSGTALVDFTAAMVSMAATAEPESAESNNNHIDMAEYKEHRKNKKKKREKREREGKEHRHHKHRDREHREHRRHRERDRERDREAVGSHHHHPHHHPNNSQHSTSASSSPSSASTTPSATIEYVGGSASASPSYLGGGVAGTGGAVGSTTTYPHNLKIRFLLSGQRTELSPPTHQTSATADVNAPLASSTSASIAVTASATAASAPAATGSTTSSSSTSGNAGATFSSNSSGGSTTGGAPSVVGSGGYPKTESSKSSSTGSTGGGTSSNSSSNKHGSSTKDISSSSNQQPTTGSSSNAPSLYVSVPLSTANVPGINLPTSSSSTNTTSESQSAPSRSSGVQSQHQQQSNLPPMGGAAGSFHSGASSGGPNGGSSSVIQHQSGKSSPALASLVSGNSGGSIISASGVPIASGNLTATTTESGNLKISYEKQTTRVQQLQEQEAPPARRSRTPDLSQASSSSLSASAVPATTAPLVMLSNQLPLNSMAGGGSTGGLKFTYESQTQLDVPMMPVSAIKDSPPSSPGSEIGSAMHSATAAVSSLTAVAPTCAAAQPGNVRKRGRKAKDSTIAAATAAAAAAAAAVSNVQQDLKDVRILQNGAASGSSNPASSTPTPPATPAASTTSTSASSIITHTAAHMLGNQINPNSSVAQKLSEQLHMEVQDHSIYTSDSINSQYAGVPFPGKQRNLSAASSNATPAPNPLQSMFSGGGINGNMPIPQSLEQLLERQWEQGSQFLMEQAQHFDIASLLNCLHQLQSENLRLEEHVTSLIARRDHLLAVNARLQIPLNTIASNAKAEAHGK